MYICMCNICYYFCMCICISIGGSWKWVLFTPPGACRQPSGPRCGRSRGPFTITITMSITTTTNNNNNNINDIHNDIYNNNNWL